MPVRRLKKSYTNVTGLFFSRKLGRLVQFDSMLERDFILLLDMHPAVASFTEQPLKVNWLDGEGVSQVYVPDFLISFTGAAFLGRRIWRPWIVETKYRSDLNENWQGIKPKIRAGISEAVRRRCAFHIITEGFLAGPPCVNARFLRRFINCSSDQPAEAVLVETLRSRQVSTPRDLVKVLATDIDEKSSLMQALWTAIAKGLIATDMESPITVDSQIWLPGPL